MQIYGHHTFQIGYVRRRFVFERVFLRFKGSQGFQRCIGSLLQLLFASYYKTTEKFVVYQNSIGRAHKKSIYWFQIGIFVPILFNLVRVNNFEDVVNFGLGYVSVVIFVDLTDHFHHFLQSKFITIEYLKKLLSRNVFKYFLLPMHISGIPSCILCIFIVINANINIIINRLKSLRCLYLMDHL